MDAEGGEGDSRKHDKETFSSVVCHRYLVCDNAETLLQEHDRVLWDWNDKKELWLDELLRLEGFCMSPLDECERCHSTEPDTKPEYQCQDCFAARFVCRRCCLLDHESHPYHRIQVSSITNPVVRANM